MKSKKVESKQKQIKENSCKCIGPEKLSRILQISRPGIQVQLSTECPEENMDKLIEKALKILEESDCEE